MLSVKKFAVSSLKSCVSFVRHVSIEFYEKWWVYKDLFYFLEFLKDFVLF
jgi:hypothetical protein